MLRVIAALIVGVVATVSAVLGANARPQSLEVTMHHAAPRVARQASYLATHPIAIAVRAPRANAITLVGVSPNGENLRVPLARAPNGTYQGSVNLATPGTWSLAVISQLGALQNTTESFAVEVATADPRVIAAAVAGMTFLFLAGGVMCIATGLRRLRERRAQLTYETLTE